MPSTLSSYMRDCINRVYAVFGVALDRPSGLGKLVSAAEQEYVGRAPDSRFAASPALVRAACDDACRRGKWGLLAGLLLGYVGLMRCAEFAAQTVRGFDVDRGLRVRDVKFGSAGGVATAVVTVRYRKTDSYNRGSAVSFVATGGPYCVVAALRHAVAGRPLDSVDPLLLRSDGLRVRCRQSGRARRGAQRRLLRTAFIEGRGCGKVDVHGCAFHHHDAARRLEEPGDAQLLVGVVRRRCRGLPCTLR